MRSIASTAFVLLGLVSTAPAGAQVFGQFTGAEPLAANGRLFGGYIHTSGNEAGLLGQLRLSFYPGIDFGFQGGFVRRDLGFGDRTTLRLGGDLKARVRSASEQSPFSISIDGALGVETGDDVSVLTISPSVIGSRTFGVGQTSIIPYARIGLAFSKMTLRTIDDSDFSFPLRAGVEFRVAQGLGFVIEVQANMDDRLNDDVAMAGGVNVPF